MKKIFYHRISPGGNLTAIVESHVDRCDYATVANKIMIADKEKSLAIAGIMGGQISQINETTKTIILESANFDPVGVRRASVRLGLRTDASARFEKSLDPQMTEIALNAVARLVFELNPEAEVISKIIDVNNVKTKEIEIELSYDLLFKRLGQEIPKKEAVRILEKLAFEVSARGESALGGKEKSDILMVRVPSFRASKDVSLPEDLIEEIARVYGYEKISARMPRVLLQNFNEDPELKLTEDLKEFLAYGLGSTESYNHSFVSRQQIEILGLKIEDHLELNNYLNPSQRYLRSTLFGGLLKNLEDNLRFYKELNFFEVGRIFQNTPGEYHENSSKQSFLIKQDQSLAGLVYSSQNDVFFQVKGLVEQLLNYIDVPYVYRIGAQNNLNFADKDYCLKIFSGDEEIGWLGLINPGTQKVLNLPAPAGLWQLNLPVLIKYVKEKVKYKSLPKYPGMVYDFSIIVPIAVVWADLRKEVMEISKIVKKTELFDTYQIKALGPDLTSLSFHVNLSDENKTLTSAEGDKIKEKIIAVLKKKFKAEIR